MTTVQDLERSRDEMVHAGTRGPSDDSIKKFLTAVSSSGDYLTVGCSVSGPLYLLAWHVRGCVARYWLG
jgi:hypothetical protein